MCMWLNRIYIYIYSSFVSLLCFLAYFEEYKTMATSESSGAKRFWGVDSEYEVTLCSTDSPVRAYESHMFDKEVLSADGAAHTAKKPKAGDSLGYDKHQASLPRLPIPTLQDTCDLYLKSIQALVTAEEYVHTKKVVEDFLKGGGSGETLHNLLLKWDKECNQPSWLEEFWNDSYVCMRDPIPVNVNFFFQFKPHPQHLQNGRHVSQIGRAASLLHAAVEYYVSIINGTVAREFERDAPVCMSQYRFVFSTSRVPGLHQDRKVCYSERPLTEDEKRSKFAEYVAASPTHCVVIIRDRFFKLEVLREDGTQYSVEELIVSLKYIEDFVTSRQNPGAPVGLLTTMDRTEWFHARERLKKLGNVGILQTIQSALICICLDGVRVVSPEVGARLLLHGQGTNRWFDRHNIIVTADGTAGVNWEHSVNDGGTALMLADFMYKKDCERFFTGDEVEALSKREGVSLTVRRMVAEKQWNLDKGIYGVMKSASEDFKTLIQNNELHVLHFGNFGGAFLKRFGISPDAFFQMALQLTYYRLFGRNCATYEAATTRTFSHGRTECIRSASSEALDFCRAACEPLFPKRIGSAVPSQGEFLRKAVAAHANAVKLAKSGLGVDRHLYGLRVMARMHGVPLPGLFNDPSYHRSGTWLMSTSHCGSNALDAFGFGPVVVSGFGIGYMIKADSIDVVITSKCTSHFTSTVVFASMLESSLFHMKTILQSEDMSRRAERDILLFSHPCGLNDFQFSEKEGFIYEHHVNGSKGEMTDSIADASPNL
ncbi:carnitine O-acetyltransferase, putative [Trypanosoma brucei brucei TREU927]|uniref:Carnitine O-acetyltransferase, putative n=2 Tax=Trypanozoon TaxID=39700 RepID=Q386T6_TRYB2|nr:carnitine O-acetyltransferase, putative [Trypanosoma brucei brucei TREU927]EAN79195.1 carnitine O-acetyltransferase, putative [Trypanosoma brucei brucei TREU927]